MEKVVGYPQCAEAWHGFEDAEGGFAFLWREKGRKNAVEFASSTPL